MWLDIGTCAVECSLHNLTTHQGHHHTRWRKSILFIWYWSNILADGSWCGLTRLRLGCVPSRGSPAIELAMADYRGLMLNEANPLGQPCRQCS